MIEEKHDHRIADARIEEQKAELDAAYQQNIAQDKAPYHGVRIRTYGELLWVFKQRQWLGEVDPLQPPDNLPASRQHPNLMLMEFCRSLRQALLPF